MERLQEEEPPECPVCLTPYDAVSTVPRVLPCGHSTCEACLLHLPHPFPDTIRCPSCNQLTKFSGHPSSLPKNIDLLRVSSSSSPQPRKVISPDRNNLNDNDDGISFLPNLRSQEFYQNWIKWVLPNIVVLIEPSPKKEITERKSVKTYDSENAVDVVLLEHMSEKQNYDNENTHLVESSPEIEEKVEGICCNDDRGNVVKACNYDRNAFYGSLAGKSLEKEYYDGMIVKTDGNNIDNNERKALFGGVLRTGEKVRLMKIGCFVEEIEGSKLKYSYEAKIIKVLYGMRDEGRDELRFVLNLGLRLHRMGKVYGFWCNEFDNNVYLVCERFSGDFAYSMEGLEHKFTGKSEDSFKEMLGLWMMGMEICEVVSNLHSEGLMVGCLSMSCFDFDDFCHVCVDFGEVFMMGRRVCRMITCFDLREGDMVDDDLKLILKNDVLENGVFVSPEVIYELSRKECIELRCSSSTYQVGYKSDVWSLACLLVWLLVGKSHAGEMCNYYFDIFLGEVKNETNKDFPPLYVGWRDKIIALLERSLDVEFGLIKEILCKCLELDPGNRPDIAELWLCIRKLVIKPGFDVVKSLKPNVMHEMRNCCVVLGELSKICNEANKILSRQTAAHNGIYTTDGEHKGNAKIDRDVIEGVSKGNLKIINLKGHFDCITGLAIGGGFLFSSSYDKIVNVWSLQDFSHVHSFKGHEHRVMAVVFVDEGESLCISGDSEGFICIWEARAPFCQDPIKKLCEQKDWRYSGIHALAISGTGYLYTGSGDKTIKVWSLQDYTLACTMSGHKSVVSCLEVSNGVLYSGSWDGTVRLWCLSDHSPLALLGEDSPGNVSSVLSLSVDRHVLVAAHENGCVKIWHNDILLKSEQAHNGAIFAVMKKGNWLFAGGWDKSISVQELSGDGVQLEARPVGSISSGSIITSLLHWQGKLFAGQADRIIKVFC